VASGPFTMQTLAHVQQSVTDRDHAPNAVSPVQTEAT
jgi:hypothetical protein